MRTYQDNSRMGRREKTTYNESRELLVFESKFRKCIEQYKSDKARNK